MFNRGFGGGFGGYGGGGNFQNQFGGNRFPSGFVGGPGNSGIMGLNRGGFRGGFSVGQQFGGGFQQQRGGGLFGRGRGSYTPRGGSRGGYRNNNTSSSGAKDNSVKKETKDSGDMDKKQQETLTTKFDAVKKEEPVQKKTVELKPRPASMDFGGPVKKTNGVKKADEKQKENAPSVIEKPPWETKKKTENKPDQKGDKLGAPWEKKKNDDLVQKASNAPWETKKLENKSATSLSKSQEPKEVPPWKQREVKADEVIDLESPKWQEDEDKTIGPPPWLQQQREKAEVEKPKPKPLMEQPIMKKEPLFDSRKRSYEGAQQSQARGQGPALKVEPLGSSQEHKDTRVTLDRFNSDLNLVINNDGFSAETLNKPMGFCFCWGGARATYGATRGKICFEVKVTRNQPVDFGDDHQEADPHVLRVGWSVDSHGFQLGEDDDSFGFGGTGKFSANCRFSNYGQTFGVGDVIMALLDLEAKPPNISFAKNGRWFGVAHRLGSWPLGVKEKALFPHVLSKNYAFEVNFGQKRPWFQPPPDFVFIGDIPLHQRVRGMIPPAKVSDCEIIMIVGLPGAGKTTWGRKMQIEHPDKRYNIIGTDTLIDKMKVNGLPRKNNYHGRWEKLIQKATNCLNKLFQIASKRCRNYILDQTNVYATARKRKMSNFEGFKRICAVLITDNPELERRAYQRTYVDGKFVPDEAVLEMKANFSLPHESEPHIDKLLWVEHNRQQALPLIEQYNIEGQKNRPPRSKAFPMDNRSQSQDRRDSRDNNDGRIGHQRSYSDRGPQGDRGRSYERNQDRAQERDTWDRNQSGYKGGAGKGDEGFPSRRDQKDDSKQALWQPKPGHVRAQAHAGRDGSPAARREDIPFKKPKVESFDSGHPGNRDARDQAWPPQSGPIKEERMDQGYDQARFAGSGKDVDYRVQRGPGMSSPFDTDDRNPAANRFGSSNEPRVQTDRGYQGNQYGANSGFGRDQRDFGRFPAEGSVDKFRSPEVSFNQPMKRESPFDSDGDNPFLARLAQLDKERPLRFDQYVKNSTRNEDDANKGYGFRRGGGSYRGRSGGRFGQDGRSGGDKKFSGESRFSSESSTQYSEMFSEDALKGSVDIGTDQNILCTGTFEPVLKKSGCEEDLITIEAKLSHQDKEAVTTQKGEFDGEVMVIQSDRRHETPKLFKNFDDFFKKTFEIIWEHRKRRKNIKILQKLRTSAASLEVCAEMKNYDIYVSKKMQNFPSGVLSKTDASDKNEVSGDEAGAPKKADKRSKIKPLDKFMEEESADEKDEKDESIENTAEESTKVTDQKDISEEGNLKKKRKVKFKKIKKLRGGEKKKKKCKKIEARGKEKQQKVKGSEKQKTKKDWETTADSDNNQNDTKKKRKKKVLSNVKHSEEVSKLELEGDQEETDRIIMCKKDAVVVNSRPKKKKTKKVIKEEEQTTAVGEIKKGVLIKIEDQAPGEGHFGKKNRKLQKLKGGEKLKSKYKKTQVTGKKKNRKNNTKKKREKEWETPDGSDGDEIHTKKKMKKDLFSDVEQSDGVSECNQQIADKAFLCKEDAVEDIKSVPKKRKKKNDILKKLQNTVATELGKGHLMEKEDQVTVEEIKELNKSKRECMRDADPCTQQVTNEENEDKEFTIHAVDHRDPNLKKRKRKTSPGKALLSVKARSPKKSWTPKVTKVKGDFRSILALQTDGTPSKAEDPELRESKEKEVAVQPKQKIIRKKMYNCPPEITEDVEADGESSSEIQTGDLPSKPEEFEPGELREEDETEEASSKVQQLDVEEHETASQSTASDLAVKDKQHIPLVLKRRHSVNLSTPQPIKKSRFSMERQALSTPINKMRSWQPYVRQCVICKTSNHITNDPTCPAFDHNPSKRICFKGPLCPMSNMYPCKLNYCGATFTSTEQAYQWKRAHDIGNSVVANGILRAIDGFSAKLFSKELDRGKVNVWRINKSIKVMKDLIEAKYQQVDEFREVCVKSEDAFLMEATFDTFWGVGLVQEVAKNCKLEFLPGKNVLGWIIMQVRNKHAKNIGSQLRDLYESTAKSERSKFIEGIGNVLNDRGDNNPSTRRQLRYSFSEKTASKARKSGLPKVGGDTASLISPRYNILFPDTTNNNLAFENRPAIHSPEFSQPGIQERISSSISGPSDVLVAHRLIPSLNRGKEVSCFSAVNLESKTKYQLPDFMSPLRDEVFTAACTQNSIGEHEIDSSSEEGNLNLSKLSSEVKVQELQNEFHSDTGHSTIARTEALTMLQGYESSSEDKDDSGEVNGLSAEEPNVESVGFSGNNRNDHFLVQSPGGFNRDRQDTYSDTSRPGNNYGSRSRTSTEDGRSARDDRDRHRDDRKYGNEVRDRRDHDNKKTPQPGDSRYHGLGEEWSGGGDSVEWQGGGGEIPPQMRQWNDPKESGDAVSSRPRNTRPSSRDTDQRWKTDNPKGDWNQVKEADSYTQGKSGPTKDVDYRQQNEDYGAQGQGRADTENYSTRAWNEEAQTKPEQKQPKTHPSYEYTDPYQRGNWNQSDKSGWQGGGNENPNTGYEGQTASEEWSGGWGNPGSQKKESANSAQKSDVTSGSKSQQYGTDYKQEYSYTTGYSDQSAQQYEGYQVDSAAKGQDQQAYSQEGNSQEWSQYGQQGWEGYGQSAGYGSWSQQTATTGGSETKAAEAGTTLPTSANQSQYSSWSEYKAATSPTDTSTSQEKTQSASNQYGHYSQTSTSVAQAKTQQWDSSSYGYGHSAHAGSGSNSAYSYGSQSTTAAPTPEISQASLLGAAANISLPPNLDLNAIQQSLAAHGFTQPPPPPPPVPASSTGQYPTAAQYHAGYNQRL